MNTPPRQIELAGTRRPAVAGMFYPEQADDLRSMIDGWLSRAECRGPMPKALIAPHAGYVYSGPIAASGYAYLKAGRDQIRTVVLLGPAHRVPVRGLAACTAAAFETPLGLVPVDVERVGAAAMLPQVDFRDDAHAQEHSLEVHLPFLQRVLGEFRVVPLAVGTASADDVAEVLRLLWGGPKTLIVVSSDLSHFHDAATAERIDRETAALIESGQIERLTGQRACGFLAIRGLLKVATEQGLCVRSVDLRNSGDTAGPKDRVVGYGAFVVTPPMDTQAAQALSSEERGALLQIAIESIRRPLLGGQRLEVKLEQYPSLADRLQATFVTLRRDGQLRGCMGSLRWEDPLVENVADSAFKAANADPRFPKLSVEELLGLDVHISVLTPPTAIPFASEEELVSNLRPGVDGVILREGSQFGVFLPSVWETLSEPQKFLQHLKQKTGLPMDAWSASMEAERFEAESIYGRVE